MSTKVYNAYKLTDPHFWGFVKDIHTKGTKSFKKHIKKFYLNMMDSVNPNTDEYKKVYKETIKYYTNLSDTHLDKRVRLNIVDKLIVTEYKKASTDIYKNLFDFDVSVCFRELDGNIYLQTFEGMDSSGVLKFIKKDPRIVDYHYQNSADKPKNISANEWDKRLKVWNKMDETGAWDQRLNLEICSYQNYWHFSPQLDISKDLYKKYKKENKNEPK